MYVINDRMVKNSGGVHTHGQKLRCPDTMDTNGLTPMVLSISYWLTFGADRVQDGWLLAILVSIIASVFARKVHLRIHSATATIQLAADQHRTECSST